VVIDAMIMRAHQYAYWRKKKGAQIKALRALMRGAYAADLSAKIHAACDVLGKFF
jgi:hypothetical protein